MRKFIKCSKCLRDHYDDQPCDRTKRPKSNWELLYPGAPRGPKPPKREAEKEAPKQCAICKQFENRGGRLASFFFIDPVFDAAGGMVPRGPQTVHKTCYRELMKHGRK